MENADNEQDKINLRQRNSEEEDMKNSLVKAMSKADKHERELKEKGRVTRFVRSNKYSDVIGHNYRIMESLQSAASNCKLLVH